MRILVLGATGPFGVILCRESLLAGHTVVIYARSPAKLPEEISKHEHVVIVQGELDDEDLLSKSVKGVDAVLSALGPMVGSPKRYFDNLSVFFPIASCSDQQLLNHLQHSGTTIADAYPRIIRAMHTHGVKRLICTGTASIKDPNDKFSFIYWGLVSVIKTFFAGAYREIVAIGEVITAEQQLEWTLVRVPILSDGNSKSVVAGYIGGSGIGATLTRAGMAAFMLGELEKNEWVKKAPAISSA